MSYSFIRYPGSKEKLWARLSHRFPARCEVYREPFVGSAAVALRVMAAGIPRRGVVLSDADPAVCALLVAVRDHPDELVRRLVTYKPRVADFYCFRDEYARPGPDVVETAFRKVVLHQISYSGLGPRAGSPIGGRHQRGEYPVGCRYNARSLARGVWWCHDTMRGYRVDVRTESFADALSACRPGDFAYLDPPYYGAGEQLYAVGMSPRGHELLSFAVRALPCGWLLSYDDCPEVRRLYAGCRVETFDMVATIDVRRGKGERRRETECLITPTGRPRPPAARTPSRSRP